MTEAFLKKHVVEFPENSKNLCDEVECDVLYGDYADWCRRIGCTVDSKTKFWDGMKRLFPRSGIAMRMKPGWELGKLDVYPGFDEVIGEAYRYFYGIQYYSGGVPTDSGSGKPSQ